jgi:hypothetical protein
MRGTLAVIVRMHSPADILGAACGTQPASPLTKGTVIRIA